MKTTYIFCFFQIIFVALLIAAGEMEECPSSVYLRNKEEAQ